MPSLNDPYNISQDSLWYPGFIVAEVAFPCSGNPNLRCIGVGPLCNVDMNRLQRITFIGPEKDGIGTYLKDLRHSSNLRAGKIPGSDAL